MGGFNVSDILFSSLFLLVPALFLTLFPPRARWAFFVLGLASVAALELFGRPLGPHHPALILPLAGLGLAAGALLVESIAFPLRLLRRRRRTAGPGQAPTPVPEPGP